MTTTSPTSPSGRTPVRIVVVDDHPTFRIGMSALLSAIPVPDPIQERKRTRVILKGDVPSPVNPPTGCRFNPRCRYAEPNCTTDEPPLIQVDTNHTVACHYWQEIERGTKRVTQEETATVAA